jgi:ketosteroid isomerase-like protein
MSDESLEVVRRWFERLNAGDPAPELCDPEVEIRNWAESPAPGPFRGPDGVRHWWATVTDPDVVVDPRPFQIQELVDLGDDRALVVQRLTATARHSGIEIDEEWGAVITVRGGKILSAIGYPSPEEARRAAGLRPGP